MAAVFCFGEFLLRMSPALNRKWLHDAAIPVYMGGAELNVATALAKWHIPVKYCSALPLNFMSKEIVEELQSKNIDTSPIHFLGKRIGVYYLQQGADLKMVDVIYDRANSSFSELKPGMIDWDEVLKDCSWFHFSAISPALSQASAELCQEALEAASAKGLTISVDLNYRAKLWQYGKKPVDIMSELLPYCHIAMGNVWAAEQLLGIVSDIKDSHGKSTEELKMAAGKSMLAMHQAFPGLTTMAYTFRLQDIYFGIFQHGPEMAISGEFAMEQSIDKVGSGDCFMAGLIYGINQKMPAGEIINFASAAAVGKMQEIGDATNQSVEDIQNRIEQNCK